MKHLYKYIITIVCGILIMLMLFLVRSTFSQSNSTQVLIDVTDAFCSAGVLLLCCGGLVFISNNGMFNMLTFSIKKVFSVFRRNEEKKMTKFYYEYNQEQRENPSQMKHLFIVGGLFLLVGIILLIIYTNR